MAESDEHTEREARDQDDPNLRDEWPLRRYLGIIRRHLGLALAVFLTVLTLGVFRASRDVPMYEASAKLLVERQSPRAMKFEDVNQSSASAWGPEFYKTQEGLLVSRGVAEIALQDPYVSLLYPVASTNQAAPGFFQRTRQTITALFGLLPTAPPEPWERLRSAIYTKYLIDTHFILVRTKNSDPVNAARIANAMARAFVEYSMQRRLELSNDVFLFLQEQKKRQEKELTEAEDRLQAFRERSNITTLDARDKDNPILRRLTTLNNLLTDKQLLRIDLESQVKSIEQALLRGGKALNPDNDQLFSNPAIREDRTVTEIRTSLVMAESEKVSLQDIYGPDHPRMQAVLSRMQLLQTKLKESLDNLSGSLSSKLQILKEEETEIERQYSEQNSLAMDLAKDALAFERFSHDAERHRKLFQALIERMSEVEINADYTRTNVELVEMATLPRMPLGSSKFSKMGTSFFLALALGIGMALLRERIDDSIRSPDDLEQRLGIPVLGFVPEIVPDKNAPEQTANKPLLCTHDPHSSIIEAYRNIRTNLFFSGPIEKTQLILVTSGGPGDGKTTTACNLAALVAQSGKRILLMDSDFRRPRVHKMFDLQNKKGLSNVLVGDVSLENAVHRSIRGLKDIENLDVLTSGPSPPNPTEILESDEFKKLLAHLRTQYERVIIDTPPVLFVSDASIISTMVDGVIMVVKATGHPRAHAKRALRQLERVKARIIGGILNRVQTGWMAHYYSDYYYYGYSKYHKNYYQQYYGADDKNEKKRRRHRSKKKDTPA